MAGDEIGNLKVTTEVDTSGIEEGIDKAEKAAAEGGEATGEALAKNLEEGLAGTEKAAADAGEAAGSGFSDKFMAGIAGVTAALGAALVGVGVASVSLAAEVDQATRDIQAKFGLTAEEAQHLSDTAVEVFGNNFGDSFEDVKNSLIDVRMQMRGLADEDLQAVTQNALMVRDTFGIEVAESTAAASVLMTQFGLTSDEAFDFIVAGNQRGLNASGDFLETIQEYGPQFAAGGADAGQFFSVLDTGFVNGVLGTDKAADAFKEFRIRITEASDEGAAALGDLGIHADTFYAGMADGSVTAADGFQLVLQKLNDISDPIERNRIGVALLGTQWEDLGPDVASSLDMTATGMDDLAGATDSLNVQYGSLGNLMQGVWRQINTDILLPIGETLLDLANSVIPYVSDVIGGIGALLAGELSLSDIADAAYNWGINIVDQLAAGIVNAATSVIDGLSYIGDIITYWLEPHSPPNLLPDLDSWGADAATVYMDGWADGDYSAFNQLSGAIKQQLDSLVDVGSIPKEGVIPALIGSRTALAAIIDSVRNTGDASEELFKTLREASPAGEAAEQLARSFVNVEKASREVADAQADLEKATAAVADAQADLNEVTSAYEDQLNPLRGQLDETERQLKALEDAKKAAKLQSTIDSADATEEEKAIARLELQKLGIEQAIDATEREKDAAVEASQAKVDAAKADEDAAKAKVDAAEEALRAEQEQMKLTQSSLAVQRENNSLVSQQVKVLEQLAKQQEQAAKASAGAGGSAKAAAGGIKALGGSAKDTQAALDDLKNKTDDSADAIDTGLVPAVTGAVSTISSSMSNLPGVASSLVEQLGPLASKLGQSIVDAIPLVAAALAQLWETIMGFLVENVPGWIAGLAQFAIALVHWVLDALPVLITNLGGVFTGMITWVLDSLPQWGAALLQLGEQLWKWIVDALPVMGTQLGAVLTSLLTWIGNTIVAVVPRLFELATAFVGWILTDVLPALPGLLGEILLTLGTFLGNVLIEVLPKLAELGAAFLNWVTDVVLPAIGGKLGEIWTSISNWIGDTAKLAMDKAGEIGTALMNGISDKINAAAGSVTKAVKAVINPVIGWLNEVIRGANSVATALGFGPIAEIPQLASGTANWGGGLAMVSEPWAGLEFAELPGIGAGLLMPGIYDLPQGSQVFDAATTAGMLQPAAAAAPTVIQQFDAGVTEAGVKAIALQAVKQAFDVLGITAVIQQQTKRY